MRFIGNAVPDFDDEARVRRLGATRLLERKGHRINFKKGDDAERRVSST
jgi:hypothetical protein